ncbi:MAG: MOSC domain-containing protein [Spirosomataceae bacterium]
MKISALYIYPVKSLGGIALKTSEVEERGLKHDRRWVLVDENNKFITQRKHPQMAFFDVAITPDGLKISDRRTKDELTVSFTAETSDRQEIKIWDDTVEVVRVSDAADAWFTKQLGFTSRLFYQPDDSVRPTEAEYNVTGDEHVSMADGHPILVVSEESLNDLNERLDSPIEMLRFRPNIVISGSEPYGEDELGKISIGTVDMYGVKRCARCVLTTIDPVTAEKGKEPLKTLMSYRREGTKIYFGKDFVVHKEGEIAVGDKIQFV